MTSEKTLWGGLMQYETWEYEERLELDPQFTDRPSLDELGVGGEDHWQPEYCGYEVGGLSDYDLPWIEFTPSFINLSEIPF